MKKNLFIWVIILMFISLQGIIVMQAVWIRNAYNVRKQVFSQKVNNALLAAVKDASTRHDVLFLASKLPGKQVKEVKKVVRKRPVNEPGLKNKQTFSFIADGDSGYFQVVLKIDDSSSEFSITAESMNEDHKKKQEQKYISYNIGGICLNKGDSKTVNLDTIKRIIRNDKAVTLVKIRDTLNRYLEKSISRVDKKTGNLESVIERIDAELKDYNQPPEKEFPLPVMKKALASALKDQEISLPFELALENPASDSLVYSTEGFKEQGSHEIYKARMYPDMLIERPEQLKVFFPSDRRYLLSGITAMLAGSGLLILVIIFTFGYTLRVLLNQKRISEIKSDFINNMTHEFKTPIATISLAVDSIKNPKVIDDPDRIKYFTGIIEEENKRMNSKVESVLQMSLIDKKDFGFILAEHDIHNVIHKVVEGFSLIVNEKGGVINFHPGAAKSVLLTDEAHMRNILNNLLDNAAKYSKDQPDITIQTFSTETEFIIRISDKGIGMDPNQLNRIFDRFYRVPSADMSSVKGFGLGLSYVKAVVLALGGKINVNSKPGEGTAFELVFPAQRINDEL